MDKEGILRMRIKQGARVDEEEVKICFGIIKKLAGKNKVLELMEGGNFYTMNEKAQKYAAIHGKEIFIASAIIIKSVGTRLLVNFFNSFINNEIPFKMFADEKNALKWLRTFRK